jgi:hypothetical protein|mmetsp:Transcript_2666/g.4978  ORF Transcript_2666/g.4978 Transcript_2666/m.4978 type:complete len:85 (-) Transcript_2666:789-1043(-)
MEATREEIVATPLRSQTGDTPKHAVLMVLAAILLPPFPSSRGMQPQEHRGVLLHLSPSSACREVEAEPHGILRKTLPLTSAGVS